VAPRAKTASAELPAAVKQRIVAAYGNLPLTFDADGGQPDSHVKFLARTRGYTLFLTATEAVISTRETMRDPVHIKLVGANPAPVIEGLGELTGQSNYIIGDDPAQWRTGVRQYAKVRYRNVYRGVDLVYYGKQQQVEHDFMVAPGADPSAIRFEVTGADRLELDSRGELVMHLGDDEVRLRKPNVFQKEADGSKEIEGAYSLSGGNSIGFALGSYDKTKPLVIDPVLSYSTYVGGNDWDWGCSASYTAPMPPSPISRVIL
jgi:hypothetical protein